MVPDNNISLINDLLARRREYFGHFDTVAAGAERFSDVDYVFTWYALSRLRIGSLVVDSVSVASMFSAAAPAAGLLQPNVATIGDSGRLPRSAEASSIDVLYSICPGVSASQWPKSVTDENSIALVYGLRGACDASLVDSLQTLLGRGRAAVALPLFSTAPGLWRAASLLIVPARHQPAVQEVLDTFTALFQGADLDPLRLAEENCLLRARVTELTERGSAEAEREQLQATIADLEIQVAQLRRGVKKQEEMIAVLQQGGSAAAHASVRPELARR